MRWLYQALVSTLGGRLRLALLVNTTCTAWFYLLINNLANYPLIVGVVVRWKLLDVEVWILIWIILLGAWVIENVANVHKDLFVAQASVELDLLEKQLHQILWLSVHQFVERLLIIWLLVTILHQILSYLFIVILQENRLNQLADV